MSVCPSYSYRSRLTCLCVCLSLLQLLKRDREIKTLQETVAKLKQQLAASQNAQQRMAKVR